MGMNEERKNDAGPGLVFGCGGLRGSQGALGALDLDLGSAATILQLWDLEQSSQPVPDCFLFCKPGIVPVPGSWSQCGDTMERSEHSLLRSPTL